MICLLHDFLVEVDLWNGRDYFVKLQVSLPLLDICIGSWMLGDWLAAAFPCGVSPRTSPCLGRPLVCFACRWLCSSLDCCWLCSCFACCWLCSSACCWLCSSRFFSSSLQIFMFFSLSLCPCCFTFLFSFFSPRARSSVFLPQSHLVVGYDSVARPRSTGR